MFKKNELTTCHIRDEWLDMVRDVFSRVYSLQAIDRFRASTTQSWDFTFEISPNNFQVNEFDIVRRIFRFQN